jgi:predicted PurR-regulated permease PerM
MSADEQAPPSASNEAPEGADAGILDYAGETAAGERALLATRAMYSPSTRLVLVAASAVVILVGMRLARDVVTPVLLSLVITLAVSPLLHWQVRKGVPPKVAYFTTLIVTALAGIMVVGLLIGSLAKFASDLPDYASRLQPYWDSVVQLLEKLGLNTDDLLSLENIDPKSLLKTGASLASDVVGLLSSLVLMALTVFFMLLEAMSISRKLNAGVESGALQRIDDMSQDMRAFIKVTTYMGAAVAALNTVLLLALGVPNAVLWGLMSFFLSFIPFIGFVIALVPPAFLGLITGGWPVALAVVLGYFAINGVSDNVIKPRIMGTQTNLSPLTVFLSVLLWGWVLGPLGGLLAVPVTLLAKRLVFEAYDEWRWLSVLLGDVPPEGGLKERRRLLGRLVPRRHKRE